MNHFCNTVFLFKIYYSFLIQTATEFRRYQCFTKNFWIFSLCPPPPPPPLQYVIHLVVAKHVSLPSRKKVNLARSYKILARFLQDLARILHELSLSGKILARTCKINFFLEEKNRHKKYYKNTKKRSKIAKRAVLGPSPKSYPSNKTFWKRQKKRNKDIDLSIYHMKRRSFAQFLLFFSLFFFYFFSNYH